MTISLKMAFVRKILSLSLFQVGSFFVNSDARNQP